MRGNWKLHAIMGAALATSLVSAGGNVALLASSGCTPQETKTAADVAVRVATDTCAELVGEDAGSPDWVVLACQAIGAAGGVVKVLEYRQDWYAMNGRAGDAAGK